MKKCEICENEYEKLFVINDNIKICEKCKNAIESQEKAEEKKRTIIFAIIFCIIISIGIISSIVEYFQ